MGFTESSRYCYSCKQQVLVRQETPNHVVHCLLTLFSCGLWGLVWLFITLASLANPWRCTLCGTPTSIAKISGIAAGSHGEGLSDAVRSLGYWTGRINKLSTSQMLAALVIMLCVLSVVVVPIWIARSNRNQTIGDHTSPVAQAPSQSPLPIPASSQNNYDRGFKSGSDYGKLIGAHPESGGMGTEEAIAQDARGSAIRDDRTRENAEWQRGWIDGYKEGFISIRGAGRKEEDFENLSWSNAFPNVKLYDHAGRHVATIIHTEPISGLITVRYKRGGAIEEKRLEALSAGWSVKKQISAAN